MYVNVNLKQNVPAVAHVDINLLVPEFAEGTIACEDDQRPLQAQKLHALPMNKSTRCKQAALDKVPNRVPFIVCIAPPNITTLVAVVINVLAGESVFVDHHPELGRQEQKQEGRGGTAEAFGAGGVS
jgi:hypothetical protein